MIANDCASRRLADEIPADPAQQRCGGARIFFGQRTDTIEAEIDSASTPADEAETISASSTRRSGAVRDLAGPFEKPSFCGLPSRWPNQMLARLFRKLSWFGVVGVASTLLYAGTVSLAVEAAGSSALLGNVLGITVSAIWSYLGHHYLTFQADGDHRTYLPRFIVQVIIGYGLSSTITHQAEVMSWHYLVGVALVIGVIPVVNFVVFQTWVFAKERPIRPQGASMPKTLQTLLLTGYRVVLATGVLRTAAGRHAYEWCYGLYKARFEAKAVDRLRDYVQPDTVVIDVGANIGFFTLRFARWLTGDGRVIAVEPDHDNFARLRQAVARAQLAEAVDLVEGAAAETGGTLHLVLNPYHPADHRLGEQGVPITAYTLDALLAERGWPVVSLIKIDVQGAEVRVLRGAHETLRRFHPALFVEIDDGALAAAGFSAAQLIKELAAFGYDIFDSAIGPSGPPLDAAEVARRRAALGYGDFLFLPVAQRTQAAGRTVTAARR